MNNLNTHSDLQDLRDIFNKYGLNYSQIVGEESTVVSCSLKTFNEALADIQALINKAVLEARKDTLQGVLSLTSGRTFSNSTDWRMECDRIIAIVSKRKEDIEEQLQKELSNEK